MTAPQEARMTTPQEAAKEALEALEHIQRCIGFANATIHQGSATWCQSEDAIASIKAALAQQGEQQPVCHGCGIPAGDVHMSTCKSGKWPSRVSNGDTAAPAPQAQDVTELVEALEMIVSTHQGHCEHHVGVSKHSHNLADIAEEALSKYKGAKL